MRRLLYALPFLLFGLVLLFVELTLEKVFVVGINCLTFVIEYRYSDGNREGDELAALGISMSLVLLPMYPSVSKLLALFMLLLVLGGLYIRALRPTP